MRNVASSRVLLWIGGEEPVLVLHIDHLACAKDLRDQEAAGVGALWRDTADLGVLLPQFVWRHALADYSSPLHQVVRQRGEAFRLEEGDAVLGEEILQHLRVLPGDRCAEHREDANW